MTNEQLLDTYFQNISGLNQSYRGYSNISTEEWIKKIEETRKKILERMVETK